MFFIAKAKETVLELSQGTLIDCIIIKTVVKNEAEVILRLSSNMIGNSDDETNFPHKLWLTNRQVANLCQAFANNLSTDIQLWKTLSKKLSKMIKTGLNHY